MRLIKPYFEILSCPNYHDLKLIEEAGRVCYKSEDKITEESHKDFFKSIVQRGHEAVLEHSQITVKFVCDRGVSHELVRHRLASFCQESTRYCNYSKDKFNQQITFIIPSWLQAYVSEGIYSREKIITFVNKRFAGTWLYQMIHAESAYEDLILDGWTPGQARSILPNSLKTEVVMTANVREWRHILKLRTSKKAHEQMRELMIPLLYALQQRIPVLFDDIKVDQE